jgi:hypothetical protein
VSVLKATPVRPVIAPAATLGLLLLAGLTCAWAAHDAPIDPARARGLLRADALSALTLIVAAGHGLAGLALGLRAPWRAAGSAALLGLAVLMGHLGAAAALLVAAALVEARPGAGATSASPAEPAPARGERARRWLGRLAPLAAALPAALGLALVGLTGGEWRYGTPGAGLGLGSASFALTLAGALLGSGAGALATGRAPAAAPLAGLGALYALLRLFSLGPWNLGWLFAALLAGCAVALWAAWQAAAAPPDEAAPWLGLFLGGLAVAGAGLASGAGVVLAGYALLLGPVLRLGLVAPQPSRAHWLLSTAAPLGGPFVAAWMGVAAAVAGGVTAAGAALWAAALLAALPGARLGAAGAGPPWRGPLRARAAAALSAGLGLGAPLVVAGLLRPVAAQLRGGLTPFGEIELWPWAGLIALDAARQPVATLPSLALAALMLILAALCWVALRLGAGRGDQLG